MLSMLLPDFWHILSIDFKYMKENYIFHRNQILQGKTILDICITDNEFVQQGLKKYRENTRHENSILDQILFDDKLRERNLRQSTFYPKQLILNIDLNFVSTIKRGF